MRGDGQREKSGACWGRAQVPPGPARCHPGEPVHRPPSGLDGGTAAKASVRILSKNPTQSFCLRLYANTTPLVQRSEDLSNKTVLGLIPTDSTCCPRSYSPGTGQCRKAVTVRMRNRNLSKGGMGLKALHELGDKIFVAHTSMHAQFHPGNLRRQQSVCADSGVVCVTSDLYLRSDSRGFSRTRA